MKRRKTYRRRKTTRQPRGAWSRFQREIHRQARVLTEGAKLALVYVAIFFVIYLAIFWR